MTVIGKTLITVLTKMSNISFKQYKRPFTVCVEGNIGSGKTTFLNYFKKFNNTTILQEPVELWQDVGGTNLLELMYANPVRYGFLFQSYVQLTMLQLHMYKTPYPYKIMERSIYSGRCFVECMKRTKTLSNVEVMVLDDWYEWSIKSANVETDLIVYLKTTPKVVYQRMKARGRTEENSVSLEYLKQVHDIHDEWLYHQTLFSVPAPVLVLNADKSLEEMLTEFENCKNHIFSQKIEEKHKQKNVTVSLSHLSSEIKDNVSD